MSKVSAFFDGNWLLHRAESAIGRFTAVPERRVPMLVLNWCCEYSLKLGADYGALCFDGGDNFRYEVFKDYKKSRSSSQEKSDTSDKVYEYLSPTIRLFNHIHFPVYQNPKLEADDLIAAGAYSFTREEDMFRDNRSAYIVCRDKDLLQRVDERVTVYQPAMKGSEEIFYTPKRVHEIRGMTPRQFLDYQVLVGDGIDDVPGVMTAGPARAILKKYGNLQAWSKTEEGDAFFSKNLRALIRNKRLISMAYRAWSPTDEELVLNLSRDADDAIVEEFGKLPKAVTAFRGLRSAGRQTLF